jgi:Kef-type K+ transport system membrane component KefB
MDAPTSLIHGDPIALVILGVTSILFFAVIGRFLARKFNQPTVVGELLMGILVGNVAWYLGVDLITVLREGPRVFDVVSQTLACAQCEDVATAIFGAEKGQEVVRIITGPLGGQVIQVAQTVDVFSRYGVIFLLFMVGLETDLNELRSAGTDSIRVALIGVVFPVALGFAALKLLQPSLSFNSNMFVAATLGATSIGITANVLTEMGRAQSKEGHIILGAAVCDDILGLIILAVVSGIVVSGSIDFAEVVLGRLDIVEAKMFTSYLFVMVLAWAANLTGLATIIGAFAAGIILSDNYFHEHDRKDSKSVSIRALIMPLEVILMPIFFILMGMQVKLETFLSWPVIVVASGLLVAAIIGKLASGLGAHKATNRLAIGIGMMPRGEVGLVFAAIGRTLGVIDDAMFSAIVLMVMVTTLIAPPLLTAAVSKQIRRESGA